MSEQQSLTVTLADIQMGLNIVDLAAERGAFKGPELSQVGSYRDKIAAFLAAAAEAEKARREAETEEAVEDTPKVTGKKTGGKTGGKTA